MIAKKNSRFDLERKRTALFHIGLLTVGSLTLAAFTYKTPLDLELEKTRITSHMIDIVTMEEPPEKQEVKDTPAVEQQQDEVVDLLTQKDPAISDEITETSNTDKEPDTAIEGVLGIPEGPGNEGNIVIPDDKALEKWPALPAQYIGGYVAMQGFISDKVRYPEGDRRLGNQGKVYLSFIVEKDGTLSNIKIERGVSAGIDREAKRVVKLFPKWKPGENDRGKKVRTRVRLPMNFTFGE